LSASNEVVAKSDYRYELVRQQSARCVGGYAYATGGFGESTTDTVYGGHSMIAENGRVLAESSQYKLKEHYIVTDIDFQKILHERQQNASFGDSSICINHKEYKYIMFNTTSQSKDVVRKVDPHPFVPSKKKLRNHRCHEIFNIQSFALAKRINHIGQNNMIIGISGGLDSTLALLVTIKTCEMLGIPHTSVHAVTMPGFGTTDRTYHNAVSLIKELGCAFHEISIKKACLQHFEDIGHDPSVHDITFENVQARERTKILMNLANQYSGIVIGTGDLSELALGWATYNGDHMSMYGVNAGIPKTLVRYVVEWYAFTCGKSKYDACVDEEVARILLDILDTPVSPELLPPDEKGEIVQKTEETVGPYELHDFFLYNMVRFGYPPKKIFKLATMGFGNQYDEATIKKWLRTFYWRFFSQQFKRSCLPDGPKIGTISLSPRSDWRMPSDASVQIWMNEIDEIEVG
jgi:NAD+ synthase (glutamine-hydrolysing)